MTKNEFSKVVADTLYKKTGKTIMIDNQDFSLKLHIEKGVNKIQLDNFYGRLIKGEKLEDVLELINKTVTMIFQTDKPLSFDEVKDRIYPSVRNINRLNKHILFEKLIDNLVICFAIDFDEQMMFITEFDLKRWGKDIKEISDLAKYNFYRNKDIPPQMVKLDKGDILFIYNTNDGYDATRILLSNRFEGKCIVGVPSRDFLYAIKYKEDINMMMFFKMLVIKEYRENLYPVSPELFVYDNGKLREWFKG